MTANINVDSKINNELFNKQIKSYKEDAEINQIEKEVIIINNDESYSFENETNKTDKESEIEVNNSEEISKDNQFDDEKYSSLNNQINPFILARKKFKNKQIKPK